MADAATELADERLPSLLLTALKFNDVLNYFKYEITSFDVPRRSTERQCRQCY